MRQSRLVRVVLEIDPDGEPIRGLLSALDNDSRPFFGWLELAGAVEAARRPLVADRTQHDSLTPRTMVSRKH